MTTQLAIRIDDSDAQELDEVVRTGRYATRTDAVRAAITDFLDRERRAAIGRQIADGYRAVPQTDDELAGLAALARDMVTEEPW